MKPIKRRFYYDLDGYVFLDIYLYSETSIEKDISDFKALSERNRDTFDAIDLPYEQYDQDFSECSGYRVNPQTKELEFSYPDPNNPEPPQVFQKPLTELITDLRTELKSTQDTLDFLLLG